MLIDKYGNVDNEIKGCILINKNIKLNENQFLQWTLTGKRLELWEGKKEYLDDVWNGINDKNCSIRRVCYWNQNSVLGFIQ